ncbi:MAG: thiamine-phosphate kinase [Parvibaculaceae bacterium]
MSAFGRKEGVPGEFEVIERLFAPLAGPEGLLLKDDAALFRPSPDTELVLTKDAIAEGRHYLAGDPPEDVARKLLRVNLSDLAAKGARARGYLLACAWSNALSFAWMERFAEGLARDQEKYGVRLYGGDTITVEGPSVFSLTAIGEVAAGMMVRRAGAQAGDELYVTGTIGDAALGLGAARGELDLLSQSERDALIGRYRLPDPPVAFGERLAEVAHAAIDVSDGLVADLHHLCDASGLGGILERDRVPLSREVRNALDSGFPAWQAVLGGGDDYQILFAAPSAMKESVEALAKVCGTRITRIGRFEPGSGVTVVDAQGAPVDVGPEGFSHF